MAIIVVIEPGRARGPSPRILNTCVRAHVGEGSVTVVVIENASAVTHHEQIRESIVVIVAYSHSHAEKSLSADASLSCDLSKASISVIPVQSAPQRPLRAVDAGSCAIHEVEIEESILVVVNPAASGTHGLGQVLLGGSCIVVLESDSRRAGHVNKSHCVGWRGRPGERPRSK